MLSDIVYFCSMGKLGNVLKMCLTIFVLQTSSLPGTSVLYLSVAFQPNLLLLALLRLAGGLTSTMVEVQCLAVWCCLVSILSVHVFGLISVLTDMGDVKLRLMCFLGLWVFPGSLCSM